MSAGQFDQLAENISPAGCLVRINAMLDVYVKAMREEQNKNTKVEKGIKIMEPFLVPSPVLQLFICLVSSL